MVGIFAYLHVGLHVELVLGAACFLVLNKVVRVVELHGAERGARVVVACLIDEVPLAAVLPGLLVLLICGIVSLLDDFNHNFCSLACIIIAHSTPENVVFVGFCLGDGAPHDVFSVTFKVAKCH